MAEVRGAVLRGILKDAKHSYAGGARGLVQSLPEDVRNDYFRSPIAAGGFYPYEVFATLIETYADLISPGQPKVMQEVGARTAQFDFNTLTKAYAALSSPIRIADMPSRLWAQRFKDAGSAASEKGETHFRFTIYEFPQIHRLHCEILTGYGRFSGEQFNKNFTNTHDRCVHRGDPDCSFLAKW